ncbi:MAG: hypothetical protein VKM01_01350 [Cyanobacteriota bacterium]|nr:hypothetical protein [Cyanobacteriota bacterium]
MPSRLVPGAARLGLAGGLLFAPVLLSLPISAMPMGELQALNRELGKLCTKPPPQALSVCRIHARLVRML